MMNFVYWYTILGLFLVSMVLLQVQLFSNEKYRRSLTKRQETSLVRLDAIIRENPVFFLFSVILSWPLVFVRALIGK